MPVSAFMAVFVLVDETSLYFHKNGDIHLYQVNSRREQRAIAVDPENGGLAVGTALMSCLEAEI